MNDEFTAIRPDQAPWTNVVQFNGDTFLGNTFRRADKRPFTLAGRIRNRDEVFRDAASMEDSFEEASAATVDKTTHQTRQF